LGKEGRGELGWVGFINGGELGDEEGFVGDNVSIYVGLGKRVDVAPSIQCIDINHHDGGSMDGGPSVGEEFLGPSTELMAGPGVGGYFLDCVAVTDPVEVDAP